MNPSATRRRNRAVIPVLVGVVAVLAAFARRDYRRWQSLGEGGVPWGLRGWLTVTRLRIAVTGCDTRDVSSYPRGAEHPLLRDLPERSDRPQIAPHPVPHRQTGDGSPAHIMVDLAELFDGQRDSRDDVVEQESRFERHHPALFVPSSVERGFSATGEIAHFHRPQGSLHLHLSPDDTRIVVERGWGEFHPLAGRSHRLPATCTLIYAPRDGIELDVVGRILAATLDRAG